MKKVVARARPVSVLYGSDARRKLMRGAAVLARAVGCTLGPSGRSVCIEGSAGQVIVTKDGATVAAAIELADRDEQMGARLLADAARKVLKQHGDGTTTTVVIAGALLKQAHRLVMSGKDPYELAVELRRAGEVVHAAVMSQARLLERHQIPEVVATACKGHEKIVDAVTRSYGHVGTDGTVVIKDGSSGAIETVLESGFRIDSGWVRPAFAAGELSLSLGETLVLATQAVVSDPEQIRKAMEMAAFSKRSLLVVAKQVSDRALEFLLLNNSKGTLRCCAVRAPYFHHVQRMLLEDLACWTGGRVASMGAADVPGLCLGYARSVVVSKDRTMLTDDSPFRGAADERIRYLRSALEKADDEYDKDQISRCIGRLVGRVAEISVDAPLRTEREQLKQQIEDSVGAVRTALRQGIVPGSGHALLVASRELGDSHGERALKQALAAPCMLIEENAGRPRWGPLNRESGPAGVHDPAGVTCACVRAAVSTACTLLLTEAAVHYRQDDGDLGVGGVGYVTDSSGAP